MEKIRNWLCQLLCSNWCFWQVHEATQKAWETGYHIGYEDGEAGRERQWHPEPTPPMHDPKKFPVK